MNTVAIVSDRVLTRRDVLKKVAGLGAVSSLAGSRLSFAGSEDAEPRVIGTERQLFLDGWIIERMTGLKRTLLKPQKKGLIQEADGREWEHGGVRWVVRDTQGRFHMSYRFMWWDAARRASSTRFPAEQAQTLIGYAVSDDGLHWRKPVLGLVEGPIGFRPAPKPQWKEGAFVEPTGFSKKNSFGYPIDSVRDMAQFGGLSEPQRRYMVYVGGPGPVYFSPDVPDVAEDSDWRSKLTGAEESRWSPRAEIAGWDEKAGTWVSLGQSAGWQGSDQGRTIARWVSEDLKSWSGQQVVLPVADDESRHQDDWVEYYAMAAYRVGDVWLAHLHVYHSDRSNPQFQHPTIDNVWMKGTVDVRLMVSRDAGKTWQRVAGKQVWIPHHEQEDGYDRMVYAGVPVRVGDELWLYYEAWDGDHLSWHRNGTTQYPDRMRIARTARAVLRGDGYVSLRGTDDAGTMTTCPLVTTGGKLTVNAAAGQGRVRVEVQDATGRALPGYALADCELLQGCGVSQPARWRDRAQLPPGTADRPLRLHFEVRTADLIGFQVGA